MAKIIELVRFGKEFRMKTGIKTKTPQIEVFSEFFDSIY
jgi:hypothetical protein